MNKIEFVEEISKNSGLTKKDTITFIESFVDVVTNALIHGEDINVTGFGRFEARNRAERNGVNPRTGEFITIPKTHAPVFKASTVLKKAINEGCKK